MENHINDLITQYRSRVCVSVCECVCVCVCSLSHSIMFNSLYSHGDCSPPGSSIHGIFHQLEIKMGCHFLLQVIFLTQGSNPHLLHLLHRQIGSLHQHHLGSPTEILRVCMLSRFSCVQLLVILWTMARLLCPWDPPGKNTGVGYLALLQGIFPTQQSNLKSNLKSNLLCLLHWQGGSLPVASPGKPYRNLI